MIKVIFRKFKEGDVIALFPDEIWSNDGLITSYQHNGQHCGASRELIDDLESANESEYKDLESELINSVGYQL